MNHLIISEFLSDDPLWVPAGVESSFVRCLEFGRAVSRGEDTWSAPILGPAFQTEFRL